jgi:hypothetical protein
MSIDTCNYCDCFVDTDEDCDFYSLGSGLCVKCRENQPESEPNPF